MRFLLVLAKPNVIIFWFGVFGKDIRDCCCVNLEVIEVEVETEEDEEEEEDGTLEGILWRLQGSESLSGNSSGFA